MSLVCAVLLHGLPAKPALPTSLQIISSCSWKHCSELVPQKEVSNIDSADDFMQHTGGPQKHLKLVLAGCNTASSKGMHILKGQVEQDNGKTYRNNKISRKLLSMGIIWCISNSKVSEGFPLLSTAEAATRDFIWGQTGRQADRQTATFHPPR